MTSFQFGFLGGGQMATAIAHGSILASCAKENEIAIYETNPQQRQRLRSRFPKIQLLDEDKALFSACERIILAVKPQTLASVAPTWKPYVTPKHLLVSIAAGIPLARLTDWFGTERIIRVMPNTPCQSLQGASGIAIAQAVSEEDRAWCDKIFGAVGRVVHVSDEQIHGVTGVSGSGPAYVLMMIEALSDGGVMAGLSRQAALDLAVQTVLGTATMVQQTGQHPAVLREQVTSPGGTTIAAIGSLERASFRAAVIDAVSAAVKRSRELGA